MRERFDKVRVNRSCSHAFEFRTTVAFLIERIGIMAALFDSMGFILLLVQNHFTEFHPNHVLLGPLFIIFPLRYRNIRIFIVKYFIC